MTFNIKLSVCVLVPMRARPRGVHHQVKDARQLFPPVAFIKRYQTCFKLSKISLGAQALMTALHPLLVHFLQINHQPSMLF